MGKYQFTETAWDHYQFWLQQDKNVLKKINKLLADIQRNGPLIGEGKPEALKGNLAGYYSRRINEKDRLIYTVLEDDIVELYSCRGHYEY